MKVDRDDTVGGVPGIPNALLHRISVESRETVETARQLADVLKDMGSIADDDNLDATYVVELLGEELSDGSIARSIRIRLAEDVR